jgi:hypothetical protein
MGSISYTDPQYAHPLISERSIDEALPLKVIYLGAGVSGIVAAIKFPEYVPNIELTIYEKNADVGGTWYASLWRIANIGAGLTLSAGSRTDTQGALVVRKRLPCANFQIVDVPNRRSSPLLSTVVRIKLGMDAILRRCARNPQILAAGCGQI